MSRPITAPLLALMIPASILGMNTLVFPAEYGLASVAFYLITAILFLLPAAWVVAAFGMKYPGKEGGVYLWVSESFNSKWGLGAVWLQWIQQVVWYPTMLSYMASTLATLLFPSLKHNPYFIAIFCIFVFCVLSWVSSMGIELSSRLTALLFVCGVLFPIAILIALSLTWQLSHSPTLLHFSWGGLLPSTNDWHNIGLFTGVITCYTGIEVCASYAHKVKNPVRTFPIAIIIAFFLILIIYTFGTLAIVMTLSPSKMELTAAVIDSISAITAHFHLHWLLYVIGLLIVFGSMAILMVWITGPILSFFSSAKRHQLPRFMAKSNRHGMPINLLIIQAVIVSLFSATFFFSSTVNNAFWLLNALAAQVYFIMYAIMFLSALKLRQTLLFRVMIIFGLFACVLSIVTPFFPPEDVLAGASIFNYELYLAIGLVVVCVLPWVLSSIFGFHRSAE